MNSKHRTGYGVFDLTRQVARRARREWEAVECPPWPASLLATPPSSLPPAMPFVPKEKRPLAA